MPFMSFTLIISQLLFSYVGFSTKFAKKEPALCTDSFFIDMKSAEYYFLFLERAYPIAETAAAAAATIPASNV